MFPDEIILFGMKLMHTSVWDKTYSTIVLQRDFHDWLQEIPTLSCKTTAILHYVFAIES